MKILSYEKFIIYYLLIRLILFNFVWAVTGEITKVVAKKHFIENDSAKVEFELYIQLSTNDMSIAYPCITLRNKKTGELILTNRMTYYQHTDDKSTYTLIIPTKLLKKRKYQMYIQIRR